MINVNVVYFEFLKFQFTSSFAKHMYSLNIRIQINKIELYFLTGSVLNMAFKIKYQNS